MTTAELNTPHYTNERLSRVNQLMDQIEEPSRVFIENNGIAGMLIDEEDPWDWSKREVRLHTGGVESYKFERTPPTGDGWPNRSIRWRDKDNLYYLLEIYSGEDVEDITMWSVVSLDYAGLREERTFKQKEPINLPMPEADFTKLLQTRYHLLHLEAAKIKPR